MLPSAREPCARAEGGERHREGTGALLGALREVWSTTRIRDSDATVTHTVVRLAFEQTVENATWASRPRRGRAANASSPLIGMTPAFKSRAADVLLAPGLMPSDPCGVERNRLLRDPGASVGVWRSLAARSPGVAYPRPDGASGAGGTSRRAHLSGRRARWRCRTAFCSSWPTAPVKTLNARSGVHVVALHQLSPAYPDKSTSSRPDGESPPT